MPLFGNHFNEQNTFLKMARLCKTHELIFQQSQTLLLYQSFATVECEMSIFIDQTSGQDVLFLKYEL